MLEREVDVATAGSGRFEPIGNSVMEIMLREYFSHCRYLRNPSIEVSNNTDYFAKDSKIKGKGDFAILECCYGSNSGHLNSAEFPICFNQLGYVIFAEAVSRQLLPELNMSTVKEFKEAQMNRCLILEERRRFKRPIDSKNFHVEMSIERSKVLHGLPFYFMNASFSDDKGGLAIGKVKIAILPKDHPHCLE